MSEFYIPTITPFSVVLLIGAAQGVFLIALLVSREWQQANRFLALLLLIFVLELIDEFCFQTAYYVYLPQASALSWAFDYLFGPFLYWYTRTVTTPPASVERRTHWAHFLPFMCALVLVSVLIVTQPPQFFLNNLYGNHAPSIVSEVEDMLTLPSMVQMAVYIVASLVVLKRHRKLIQQNFSYDEKINLAWLRRLLWLLGALYLTYLSSFAFDMVFGNGGLVENLLYLAIVASIYILGYYGARQPMIFSHKRLYGQENTTSQTPQAVNEELFTPSDPTGKYRNSALIPEQCALIVDNLRTLMVSERPYLDNQLTLPKLAAAIDLPINYVSQAINDGLGLNFFDFVNQYRVEEAKRALTQSGDGASNILQIAHDAGFNSKSAFYTAFKKNTGMTPTQFRTQFKKTIPSAVQLN